MPTYTYECSEHGIFTKWWSIHDDSSVAWCPRHGDVEYRAPKVHIAPPMISAFATPSKLDEARAITERDGRWSRDMDAYKRLRLQHLQPRQIDGCAELETRATSRTEIEMGAIAPSQDALKLGNEISSELFDRDCTEEGPSIGEWFRGEKKAVEG